MSKTYRHSKHISIEKMSCKLQNDHFWLDEAFQIDAIAILYYAKTHAISELLLFMLSLVDGMDVVRESE